MSADVVPARRSPAQTGPEATSAALTGRARAWFGISLALVAANLRPAITSLPPLLPEISHAYRLGPVASSLLVAVPVLLLGAGSPLAALLVQRLGLAAAIDAGLVLISAGVAARSLSVSAMFPGTALAALGIAVVAVLLPAWIAWRDPLAAGIWTSVYALAMALGASLAPALSGLMASFGVPLSTSLLLWALLPLVALVVRAAARSGPAPSRRHPADRPRWLGLIVQPPVLALTGFFLLQALLFFSIVTWLPAYARALGGSVASAGLTLAIFSGVGMVGAWAVPVLATRARGRVLLATGLCACGTVGFILLAAGAPLVPAVAFLALGQGGAFPMALALIGLLADGTRAAAAVSTVVQGVGFGSAAVGLAAVAVLRAGLGTWSALWWLLAGVAVVQTVTASAAARPATVTLATGRSWSPQNVKSSE